MVYYGGLAAAAYKPVEKKLAELDGEEEKIGLMEAFYADMDNEYHKFKKKEKKKFEKAENKDLCAMETKLQTEHDTFKKADDELKKWIKAKKDLVKYFKNNGLSDAVFGSSDKDAVNKECSDHGFRLGKVNRF